MDDTIEQSKVHSITEGAILAANLETCGAPLSLGHLSLCVGECWSHCIQGGIKVSCIHRSNLLRTDLLDIRGTKLSQRRHARLDAILFYMLLS